MVKKYHVQMLIFVLFGFFKAFKPSEPFLTPYLMDYKHLTKDQVKNEVYPVWSYSYFALIIPMAIMAELVGYKPVIMFEAFGHLATRAILIWAEGLAWMQAMQVTFAIAIAGELVYYSYVFRVFLVKDQQKLQSFSRCAVLMGHCIGSLLGQILLLEHLADYLTLFYISGGAISLATIVSLFFVADSNARPSLAETEQVIDEEENLIKESLIRKETEDKSEYIFEVKEECFIERLKNIIKVFRWRNMKVFIIPLLIYALNKTHLYNVESFASVLWRDILEKQGTAKDAAKVLNGYADAASRFCASVGSILAWLVLSKFKTENSLQTARYASIILCLAGMTAVTFVIAEVDNIYLSYSLYALIVGLSGTVSAIASTWLGQSAFKTIDNSNDFALIFGLATFICAGAQSLMLIIVSSLNVSIYTQFSIFGGFGFLLTFFVIGSLEKARSIFEFILMVVADVLRVFV
ncbi:hypothetical protein MP638_006323 [Amoeboaphelidium occidentale]|nr:hypothetical protein MP638_006323 [Amoeboaphelidium occidentale]